MGPNLLTGLTFVSLEFCVAEIQPSSELEPLRHCDVMFVSDETHSSVVDIFPLKFRPRSGRCIQKGYRYMAFSRINKFLTVPTLICLHNIVLSQAIMATDGQTGSCHKMLIRRFQHIAVGLKPAVVVTRIVWSKLFTVNF